MSLTSLTSGYENEDENEQVENDSPTSETGAQKYQHAKQPPNGDANDRDIRISKPHATDEIAAKSDSGAADELDVVQRHR